ncbi:MAG: HVO_A0114 family putative DNA-binding protein [Thermoplasmatota archaeon]
MSNLEDFEADGTDTPVRVMAEWVVPDRSIDLFTLRRLRVLLFLQGCTEPISLRALARELGRDVKGVSEDVHALADIGLLRVDARGRGRPMGISLPAVRVSLHLMEPKQGKATT